MIATVLHELNLFIGKNTDTLVLWLLFGFLIVLSICLAYFCWRIKSSMEKRIQSILYYDTVTGKENLLMFKEHLSAIIHKDKKNGRNYAVVYVSINRFATLFHKSEESCNMALRIIADVWDSVLDKEEYFTRVDEECFVSIKKYECVADISDFLDVLNTRFNEEFSDLGYEVSLLLKCGVVTLDASSNKELLPEMLIEQARCAALSISTTRESEVVFYNDLLAKNIVMEREVESMMLPALKNHEFELYLQPKFDIVENHIVGAEALVRWQSPKGLLMPDRFIPIFEKNGFVRKLDMYMFEEVCSLLHHWMRTGQTPTPISINMSRTHLNNSAFIKELQMIMRKYHIPYHLIEIELTESAFMDEDIDVVKIMTELKSAGFRLSMDDFGSGYSSLNMLRHIPVDVVKIDKGFMGRSDMDAKGQIVVKNIVSMIKELGLDIICEGVETIEQAEFLKAVGCERVQGYLYSRPITVKCFEEMNVTHA